LYWREDLSVGWKSRGEGVRERKLLVYTKKARHKKERMVKTRVIERNKYKGPHDNRKNTSLRREGLPL